MVSRGQNLRVSSEPYSSRVSIRHERQCASIWQRFDNQKPMALNIESCTRLGERKRWQRYREIQDTANCTPN